MFWGCWFCIEPDGALWHQPSKHHLHSPSGSETVLDPLELNDWQDRWQFFGQPWRNRNMRSMGQLFSPYGKLRAGFFFFFPICFVFVFVFFILLPYVEQKQRIYGVYQSYLISLSSLKWLDCAGLTRSAIIGKTKASSLRSEELLAKIWTLNIQTNPFLRLGKPGN